ncbi:MAG: tRNA dihydrouridine synthase DusB [Lachnospiraceae bacterium]|nr:tRNA dihydrouridine synthase DusB [Lachnospiraceae bacterium]MBR5789495.1 tRNA dihydrouridine synthase DusB [Lachnospiraceae bacterium]
MKTFKIGNVELNNRYILAPMAGVTDLPYRVLCSRHGAGMVCSEMVSAKGIYYNNKNTVFLLSISEEEAPVSLQLFGSDPKIISEMAKRIEERPFSILDINMGCPVPKVVGNGEGSALMKDPVLVGKIVEATAKAIHKPVTVKIRAGFDKDHVNAEEIAHVAEESGAAAVAVHGRTREQFYSGEADWDIIARVKNRVKIPVIGSGDVTDYKSANEMFTKTGVDAIMIGRAARGNPWIFDELIAGEEGREYTKPSLEELLSEMLTHAKMLCEFKGEYIGIREMRTHASFYLTGQKGAAKARVMLNSVETLDDLYKYVEVLLNSVK